MTAQATPLSHGDSAVDAGTFALLLQVAQEQRLRVGAMGRLRLPPGAYVYAGAARRGLAARLDRLHGGRGGRRHVDKLAPLAATVESRVFPDAVDECELAAHVARLPGALPVIGFGATACPCLTHMYGFLDADASAVAPGVAAWPAEEI